MHLRLQTLRGEHLARCIGRLAGKVRLSSQQAKPLSGVLLELPCCCQCVVSCKPQQPTPS